MKPIPGDPGDPHGFPVLIGEFCEWMTVRNYSQSTIKVKRHILANLAGWLFERGVTRPAEVSKEILETYQRALHYTRQKNGRPLSPRTQAQRLTGVRVFFAWLARTERLLDDPAAELEMPREEQHLPRGVLSAAEAERVLAMPDLSTPLGLRDRAMLELLYATGVRRSELAGLALSDLDIERRALTVRQGKGHKDRMIPTGARAAAWCERYLRDARPRLAVEPDPGFLFLSRNGGGLGPTGISVRIGSYLRGSGVGKAGACHIFRHTVATLMLDGGADIRYIQQMLGHASIRSTQIYTQVSLRALEAVHAATHPAASNEPHSTRRERTPGTGGVAERGAAAGEAEAAELRRALDAMAAAERGKP